MDSSQNHQKMAMSSLDVWHHSASIVDFAYIKSHKKRWWIFSMQKVFLRDFGDVFFGSKATEAWFFFTILNGDHQGFWWLLVISPTNQPNCPTAQVPQLVLQKSHQIIDKSKCENHSLWFDSSTLWGPPSDVCWFISPSDYSYEYHKP